MAGLDAPSRRSRLLPWLPRRITRHEGITVRHPQSGQLVEYPAAQQTLTVLRLLAPGTKPRTQDRLLAHHRRLHQRPARVTRGFGPATPTVLKVPSSQSADRSEPLVAGQ